MKENKPYIIDGKQYFEHGQAHRPEDRAKLEPYALLFQHTPDGATGLKVVRKIELDK